MRKERIENKLVEALNPVFLNVENESHNHHVPANSETHFKLTVVAELFQQLDRLDRHRKVNNLLTEELKNGLHALSLHLYSPIEWKNKHGQIPLSPACRGGYDHD
ncbi:BolA family protein [Legionella sp. D16C41]|uniref:BolA family protein n=1 Tax=Legionella sp. D16C41 TaxID=3402688 RepID=UPI003AF9A279